MINLWISGLREYGTSITATLYRPYRLAVWWSKLSEGVPLDWKLLLLHLRYCTLTHENFGRERLYRTFGVAQVCIFEAGADRRTLLGYFSAATALKIRPDWNLFTSSLMLGIVLSQMKLCLETLIGWRFRTGKICIWTVCTLFMLWDYVKCDDCQLLWGMNIIPIRLGEN